MGSVILIQTWSVILLPRGVVCSFLSCVFWVISKIYIPFDPTWVYTDKSLSTAHSVCLRLHRLLFADHISEFATSSVCRRQQTINWGTAATRSFVDGSSTANCRNLIEIVTSRYKHQQQLQIGSAYVIA